MGLKEDDYQQYGEPLGARQFYSVVRELRAFEKFAVSDPASLSFDMMLSFKDGMN